MTEEIDPEVLDATDPETTRRVRPVVLRAFLLGSSSQWLVSVAGGGALGLQVFIWAHLAGQGWPLLPLLIGGVLLMAIAYAALLWCTLTYRWQVRSGDFWHVLVTPVGQAVALVQPRDRGLLVTCLAAQPKGHKLGKRLLMGIVVVAHTRDQTVVCDAMLDNIDRYRRWGLLPDGRYRRTLGVMAKLRSRPRIVSPQAFRVGLSLLRLLNVLDVTS